MVTAPPVVGRALLLIAVPNKVPLPFTSMVEGAASAIWHVAKVTNPKGRKQKRAEVR